MPARPLRFIQAGLGEWGQDWRAKVLPLVPSAKTVAYAEPSAAIRANFDAPAFASLEQALAKSEAEAVLITSSIISHIPLIRQALTAGKHVLVEKPFASSVREAKEVADLAAERGLVLMVSQNYRRFPAPEAVAELVQRNELGVLESISVRFDARMTYDDPNAVHYRLEQPLLEAVSIHHLDLMRFVSGEDVTELFCRSWSPPGSPYRGAPSSSIVAQLQGGAVIDYSGTVFASDVKTPLSGRWAMRFSDGVCVWTSTGERDPTLVDDRVAIRRPGGELEDIALPRPALYGRPALLTDFVKIVRGGAAPRSCSLASDNLHTLAMLEAAILSSRTHQQIKLAALSA